MSDFADLEQKLLEEEAEIENEAPDSPEDRDLIAYDGFADAGAQPRALPDNE